MDHNPAYMVGRHAPMSEDKKAMAFATLIPGAVAIIGNAIAWPPKDIITWWQGLKKPSYYNVSKENEVAVVTTINLSVYAPLIYATYHVCKETGGFETDDGKRALGSYVLFHAIALANCVAKKKRCLKGLFGTTAGLFGSSCLISYFYHKVNEQAGHLTLPFTTLLGLGTILTYHIWEMNDEKDKK